RGAGRGRLAVPASRLLAVVHAADSCYPGGGRAGPSPSGGGATGAAFGASGAFGAGCNRGGFAGVNGAGVRGPDSGRVAGVVGPTVPAVGRFCGTGSPASGGSAVSRTMPAWCAAGPPRVGCCGGRSIYAGPV